MIITIDTTRDSQEDIRRAISLLQQIAHGSSNQQSYTHGHTPPVNSAFDFSTPSSSAIPPVQSAQNTAPADNGFAAMFGDMGSNSNSSGSQVQVTSSLSNQPLSNVAATNQPVAKKREKYDFETY